MLSDTLAHAQAADFPESAQALFDVLGRVDALALIAQAGGSTLGIPKLSGHGRYAEHTRRLLEGILSHAGLQALVSNYGGETLYIPNCKAALQKARDRAIHDAFDGMMREGLSGNEAVALLAVKYRLSDRRVWEVLKTLP